MTIRVHPLGIGESLGDDLLINGPLVHTGQVWWVNSATGSDAASPRGLERHRPLATLQQAVTNASNGDIIVLMDGHTETIASTVTISERLTIVGSGSSSGIPTARLGVTGDRVMLDITGDRVELRNIRFNARSTAGEPPAKVAVTGDGFRMRGCYLEAGNNDSGAVSLYLGGDYPEIRSTTFISTASAVATAPGPAISPEVQVGCYIEDCVFDGGTVGWASGYAIEQNGLNTATTDFRAQNITLTRGSDVRLISTTTGYVLANAGSYAPRIDWDGVVV
jgi:hypothetical protein